LFNLRFWSTKALATYDKSSNIVRLVVPYSTSFVKPKTGMFYYITILDDWRIWESHPFTLGYSTSGEDPPRSSHGRPPSLETIISNVSPTASEMQLQRSSHKSGTLLKTSSTTPPLSIVFIIRPYDGFISRLRDFALLHPTKLRVLIGRMFTEKLKTL
jgi:hypothetical protein